MFPQQKGFVMPPDLLIGSSDSFEFLKLMTDARMFPLLSPKTKAIKELYKGYATGPFRLVVVNCMGSVRHYNTIDVAFDATSDDIFQHVRVYDSLRPLRKTTRANNNNNNNADQVAKSSSAGEFLRLLQTFLVRFCFFDNDDVVKKLKSDPTYILKNAVNKDSPQQTNVWDCGLFSLGVALHLVNGIEINRDIFAPHHISTFRTVLYAEYQNRMTTTTGRRRASSSGGVRLRGFDGRFIYSFFPQLEALSHPLRLVSSTAQHRIPEAVEEVVGAVEEEAAIANETVADAAVEEEEDVHDAAVEEDVDDAVEEEEEEEEEQQEEDVVDAADAEEAVDEAVLAADETNKASVVDDRDNEDEDFNIVAEDDGDNEDEDFNVVAEDDDADNGGGGSDDEDDEEDEEPGDKKVAGIVVETGCPDHYFLSIFMPPLIDTEEVDYTKAMQQEEYDTVHYDDMNVVFALIEQYEDMSGIRLAIRSSMKGGKVYCCTSHENCSFRVKFGRFRSTTKRPMIGLGLKPKYSNFIHCGAVLPEKPSGRAGKRRIKGKLENVIRVASDVKSLPLTAMDVRKGAVSLEQVDVNYQQSYSVLARSKRETNRLGKKSFETIVPYLQEFSKINPGTAAIHECNEANQLLRLFVCPGMMLHTLRFVRPVMSLDAAHMKTTGGGGTLYMASVKSASNDLYPVALSLMVANENKDGWVWFLESLQACLPIIDHPHPKESVGYKRFTFMSDRQKGLVEALKQVFPNNHSCHCAVHIQRNVETNFSKRAARDIVRLAKTFSVREAEGILEKMHNKEARKYVEGIDPNTWMSTAWLSDETLPPRFGIVTSNMSESLNSMFDQARDLPWKSCLHTMLTKMVERIYNLSVKYSTKEGVVDEVVSILKDYWQNCAGMSVVEVDGNRHLFTVIVTARGLVDTTTAFNLNPTNKACDCGKWQDLGYPCIHGVTVFKKQLGYDFDRLLQGRQKKKRAQKRSRSVTTPEGKADTINRKCSRCGRLGHNVRTCRASDAEVMMVNTGNDEAEAVVNHGDDEAVVNNGDDEENVESDDDENVEAEPVVNNGDDDNDNDDIEATEVAFL